MNKNRERLTIVEECKLIVLLERNIITLQERINTTDDFFIRDMYTNDIKELTDILIKLK